MNPPRRLSSATFLRILVEARTGTFELMEVPHRVWRKNNKNELVSAFLCPAKDFDRAAQYWSGVWSGVECVGLRYRACCYSLPAQTSGMLLFVTCCVGRKRNNRG